MSITYRALRRASLFTFERPQFVCKIFSSQMRIQNQNIVEARFVKSLPFHDHLRQLSNDSRQESCWKCGRSGREKNFFCEHCKSLQKPDLNYNYFEIFGMCENFDIKSNELTTNFRKLQALLHPDKFTNASEKEKSFSADSSSLVNKAFKTLSDPLKRGLYILHLQNIPVHEENTSLNKEFLMEIMELNEELESIADFKELQVFHSRNKDTLKLMQQKVSAAFAQGDKYSARRLLMEMKYFTTLEEKIKEKKLILEN